MQSSLLETHQINREKWIMNNMQTVNSMFYSSSEI